MTLQAAQMKENLVCRNVDAVCSVKEVEQLLVVEMGEQYLGGASLLRCIPRPLVCGPHILEALT